LLSTHTEKPAREMVVFYVCSSIDPVPELIKKNSFIFHGQSTVTID